MAEKQENITQKNELYGEQDQESKDQINNQTQYKNDKRKKKKRRPKPRHSPEYYEQLKRKKENLKKQSEWDSRFNLAVIPDLFDKSAKNIKPKFKLKSLRRSESNRKDEITYKTFNAQNQQKTSKKYHKAEPAKSFNIRIVSKKEQTEEMTIKKETLEEKQQHKKEKNENDKQSGAEKEKEKQGQQDRKNNEKMVSEADKLIEQVNKVYEELKFYQCHKDILIDIITNSKQKTLRSFVHAEIAKLKGKTSNCSSLQSCISKREQSIKQLTKQPTPPTPSQLKKYRLTTLRVIEQILKWRDEWQRNYSQQTSIKPKIHFTIQNKNYLSEIQKCFQLPSVQDVSFIDNPFLLGLTNQEVQTQLIVRIRACEMLLLENQLECGVE